MAYESDLRGHSELFSSMLQLIPSGYYVMKDEDFVQSTKYYQNKKRKTPKEVHKEKRMKAKRLKLDPSENDKDEVEEEDQGVSDGDENVTFGDPSLAVNVSAVQSVPLDELKQRLRKKIEGMRSVRNVDGESTSKKKKEKNTEGHNKAKKPSVSRTNDNKTTRSDGVEPGAENDQQIQFNRLKLDSKDKKVKKKHGLKELEFVLEKARAHQKKIEDVSKVDSKKGESLMEEEKWNKAFAKASGTKKKDDPALLQKTIKKIEKQKKRSSKEWKKRKETQDEFKKKRQVKREKNIKERIEQKKKQNAGKRKGSNKGVKRKIIR